MNLIVMKFLTAAFVVVGLMLLAMVIGASWICSLRHPHKSAPSGSRHHPDRKNHVERRASNRD